MRRVRETGSVELDGFRRWVARLSETTIPWSRTHDNEADSRVVGYFETLSKNSGQPYLVEANYGKLMPKALLKYSLGWKLSIATGRLGGSAINRTLSPIFITPIFCPPLVSLSLAITTIAKESATHNARRFPIYSGFADDSRGYLISGALDMRMRSHLPVECR